VLAGVSGLACARTPSPVIPHAPSPPHTHSNQAAYRPKTSLIRETACRSSRFARFRPGSSTLSLVSGLVRGPARALVAPGGTYPMCWSCPSWPPGRTPAAVPPHPFAREPPTQPHRDSERRVHGNCCRVSLWGRVCGSEACSGPLGVGCRYSCRPSDRNPVVERLDPAGVSP